MKTMQFSSRHCRQGGFTFVEILVVVVIISIIVTGIVVVGGAVREKARVNATKGLMQNLASALREYKNYREANFGGFNTNNNTWIETLYEVPECKKILNNIPNEHKDNLWPLPVANEIVDTIYDSWGERIEIRSNGAGNFPTVLSRGPDKIFNTADDITSDKL